MAWVLCARTSSGLSGSVLRTYQDRDGLGCSAHSLGLVWELAKRLGVGRPLRSDRLGEQLLPKRIALPIFASDPLSSVAYATQEILLVLTLGGLAYLYLAPGGGIAV